jgi:hypothetical protein
MNRRESLALVVGAVTSLAGCGRSASSSSNEKESGPPDTVADGPSSGTEADPETVLVRADTDRQPVWLADPDREDGGRPTPRPDGRHVESEVIDDQARADRVTVDSAVDSSQVTSFLQATEFESETVFLDTIRLEECFRLNLCHISWQPQKISTDYTRQTRHWSESCAVDKWVFEARLVRIPDTIDADNIRAGSTSVGTGACRQGGEVTETMSKSGRGESTPATGSATITNTNTTLNGDR